MGKKRPPPPPKPKQFHHSPFQSLKGVELPRPAPPKPVPAPKPAAPAPVADERLFEEEMAGVAPLAADPRGRLGAPPPQTPRRVRVSDEAEAYAQLADLVEGVGSFDIADSDEYVEGIAPGIDKRLLRKLRKGDYAVQSHLDLHGMTSEEARGEVERFVESALLAGKRCLLIIHGRGLNSKDNIPVLKERLKVWLTRGRIARRVLAFATARPADGGAGAVYVLLRR
jgi:DNA-nicking Smr family endonuclease